MASRRVTVTWQWVLASVGAVACSSETHEPGASTIGAGGGGHPTSSAGTSGAPVAGTGRAEGGASGLPQAGAAAVGGGGQSGAASAATTGGVSGASGSAAGGAAVSGSAGQSSAGGGAGGSGGHGNAAECQMVKLQYAAELEKQLGCAPNAANQCKDSVPAAPGCSCRVFMQPTDPFAIEHLANVTEGWYGADCENPSCPAQCTTATVGKCQADSKFAAGGRCVTP